MSKNEFKDVSRTVIGAAIEVHKRLGPGYLEAIYERALCLELAAQGVAYERQFEFTVLYKGKPVGKHRLDLIAEGNLVIELKATNQLDDSFFQVVRSYITALGETEGLLLNFGTNTLQVKRVYANHNQTVAPVSIDAVDDESL